MKKAFITGITGQDGSYLSELLLKKGYEVHGLIRREDLEDSKGRLWRLEQNLSRLHLHPGSLESFPSLFELLKKVEPDELYHLAAQSFVSYNFDDEFSTMSTNVNGTHFLLSAFRVVCPNSKFYFAGSSEMFGKAADYPQSEETRFKPRSVYGLSKMVGHELVRNYRESHNLFACTGILFNHESPRRGAQFVTRKISINAALIKLGRVKELRLGNLDAKRDWGASKDYVEAIWKMLDRDCPEDFVIGTGKTHTVRNFLEIAFSELSLNYLDYVVSDEKFFRVEEPIPLVANAKKANTLLNWKPKISFEELVVDMVRNDYNFYKTSSPV